jgi:hypothetical protein
MVLGVNRNDVTWILVVCFGVLIFMKVKKYLLDVRGALTVLGTLLGRVRKDWKEMTLIVFSTVKK